MAKRATHLGHLYSLQPPVLAAVQEKQHGDASAARGALRGTRRGSCKVPGSPARTTGTAAPSAAVRSLLHDGVAQPPAAEELHVHPHGGADEPQLLGAHPGADLHAPASDEEQAKGAVGLVELRAIGVVVDYYQDLVPFLHLQLLGRLRDLALLLDGTGSPHSSQ